nr:efflux RND transporter permease subunit [Chlamydiales bacterium]
MIKFFVKRPITTIMFISLFVVMGLVSFFNLNVEKMPKVDFPLVTATFVYPGAAPEEMESLVINKVEDALSQLSEVKKIRSQCYENFAYVFVEFLLSADVNTKFIEVKDKVDSLLNTFPANMKKPIVQKFDPFVSPVIDLVLTSDSLNDIQLYDIADNVLKEKLLALKGVASVDVIGGKERQINVKLDPMLMKEHYIALEDVSRMIQAKNLNIPSGEIQNSLSSFNLKFVGEYEDLDQLRNTPLMTRNGEIIPLSAIASIEDGYKKVETVARYNGKTAIALSVKKSSDSNALKVAGEIKAKMKKFQASIPGDATLDIASDDTVFIARENHHTEFDILIGILLTIAILFLFTGNFRLTFIALVTIPLSIISACFLMDSFGFSINFLTLLAIASSIGTLISNTIVVVESFWMHLNKGKNSFDAAVEGTKSVA